MGTERGVMCIVLSTWENKMGRNKLYPTLIAMEKKTKKEKLLPST
jgi:hypothetical protein